MKKELILILLFSASLSLVFSQKPDSTALQNELELLSSDDFNEGFFDEETGGAAYIPGLLHSSADVFVANTGYNLSIAWFRSRGLDSKYQTICMNGLMLTNPITGRASYSQWGGLNHVIRYPDNVLNNNPATFTFGSIGGTANYTLRASTYRQQIRATYSLSNRSYNNRLMVTGSTGLMKNNWAFTASLSTRFGNALSYVDGTYYNGLSYFLSAEKKFNAAHSLGLTVFGAYTDRATQGNAVNEIYQLLGTHYYNPNWGLQSGKPRAAKVKKTHEPVILLTHFFKPENKNYQITSTLGSTFGKAKSGSLDWYSVSDPRPDYYRYLPSYQEDPLMRAMIEEEWKNNINVRQIDWDNMYEINQYNAAINKRAQYILKDYVSDHFQLAGASHIVAQLAPYLKLSAGLDVRGYSQRNYQQISDMLGGLFWTDYNKYAEGDSPENPDVLYNDLDNKDSVLKVGDKYGYDYRFNIFNEKVWAIAKFSFPFIDFHLGADVGSSQYWREGLMRNGLFPDNSKGNSEIKSFLNFGVKAGLTYKINGRNYLILNGSAISAAPTINNVFLSPRTHNKYVDNLNNEKYFSADFSYLVTYPIFKMRLTGYYTQFYDISKLTTFYHDEYGALVNYSMTGIDQRYMGIELGFDLKLGNRFSLVGAANIGDYTYTNNPEVTIIADNGYAMLIGDEISASHTVYFKNYHVAAGPQVAGSVGIKYNYDYWWAGINVNYFDRMYADMNPERRTTAARGTLDENSELFHSIIDQTRLKRQFTVDASLSKSWRVKKYIIGFNLSATNILNNKNLVTTAWEQYRFDYKKNDVNKYPIKYYYAFGTTFYAGFNITF
ncbi:MAG TPA: hypothetical protein PLB66_01600 [Bacteroidales bacterium]|jgi:hypothetical protein|nr:TonB-dependent receptor [Bacteroidales bacterium]HOS57313.1 hypothetical protein [Bacteroidales bacterium]